MSIKASLDCSSLYSPLVRVAVQVPPPSIAVVTNALTSKFSPEISANDTAIEADTLGVDELDILLGFLGDDVDVLFFFFPS